MKKISSKHYILKKTMDYFMVGMFIVVLLFMWTLYKGPISIPYLKPYIVEALNYDESEYNIGIGDVNLEFVRSIQPLRITANNVSVKKNDDNLSIVAPKLYLSFSLRALLKGIIAPSDIKIDKPTMYIFADYGVVSEDTNQITKRKLEYYVEKFNEFLNNYNSPDKIYPESFVNNITITDGEVEFHEVSLGRKWVFSDLNFEFNRNVVNLELNANSLINLNDKIASIGFESEYHTSSDILDLEVYFSDFIASDIFKLSTKENSQGRFSDLSIDVPLNGKIDTSINLYDILKNPSKVSSYLESAIEKINFELDGGAGYIAFSKDATYNYPIEELFLSGEVVGGIDEINIENADFKMGGQKAKISFKASGLEELLLEQSNKNTKMTFTTKIKEFSLDDLSKFWPQYIVEPAWKWCKDGLTGGLAKNAEFIFEFGYDEKDKTWGFLDLNGTAELHDGNLFYLTGMPVVENIYGKATFTNHNISIDINEGNSDGVTVSKGNVNIYDLNKADNFISIDIEGKSSITDALNLINNPPLEFASEMGVDPKIIQGNVDVKLKLDFELRRDLEGKDIKVDVDAILHDIKISELVPQHVISAEKMSLNVNSAGWRLEGDAKYDTIPVKLSLNEKFADKTYKSKCNISFNLDDNAKKILGIDWSILRSPYIDGYAVVNADIVVKENSEIDIDVKADFSKTKIDYAFLGFVKEVNEQSQGTAKVKLLKDKVASISNIKLFKPDFEINGNVLMYPNGRVKLVDITKINGPKTSAKAKINISDSAEPKIKVDVSGSSYDLTALFDNKEKKIAQKVQNKLPIQENDDDGLENTNDTDIFIAVNSLWTNPSTPIKNFAGSAKVRQNKGIDEVHMIGNYGVDKSIKIALDYIPKGNNEHYLSIDSNNAGSTLKVLRLYDNMVGGTLKIEARRQSDKKFVGHAQIRDFSIKNAPVVAKLLTVASFKGMLDLLKGNGLTFTHFNAPFEYQYKVLKLNQAKAEGNVVGVTATGSYNRATEDIRMDGVLIPAYSLNKILGKIPLVGNLLASKDGTIFAATYNIKGKGNNPKVKINSLSMLSPNSLKEWYNRNFGKQDGEKD